MKGAYLYPREGTRIRLEPDGDQAEAACPCPECGVAPLRVMGRNLHIGGHDYYEATAIAVCCEKAIGSMRAYVSTIFGLEEDEAVLVHGRPRVY